MAKKKNKFNEGDKVKVRNIFPELNPDHVWTIKAALRDNNYLLISDSKIDIVIHEYDLTLNQ